MSEKSRGTFLLVQNLFVMSVILYFFLFFEIFFLGNASQCEDYEVCSLVAVAPHCPR